MKFGGIGVPELLIILAVALLIFGPKNLPKLGSALGKTVKNLREGMSGKGKDKDIEEADDSADESAEKVSDDAKSEDAASDTKAKEKKQSK
ncbi:MAG: twin-arginine translocase TatA/TatE family subunit [Eggerthellaceae bacterium]|jgi:sec-independent protein translocase protein TatA|nr:twin-arginine translocase TatA/TatE family subunit [Eggerthellaceae bacterium]MCH4220954.1 twin-arginine translocase TatA/TatE family subunit [Eggerthellaceae bacterium]